MYTSAAPEVRRVGDRVGVSERWLFMKAHGGESIDDHVDGAGTASSSAREQRQQAIHLRFYTALALNDMTNEANVEEVAGKYGCSRGYIQSLQAQVRASYRNPSVL